RLTAALNQRALKCGDRSFRGRRGLTAFCTLRTCGNASSTRHRRSGGRGRHARSLAGRGPLLVELSGTDRRGHVLQLVTIDRAVPELDDRIEPLPGHPL